MRFQDFYTIEKDDVDNGESLSSGDDNYLEQYVDVSEHDAALIRQSIIEELEAISDYTRRAEMSENDVVRTVFLDIAKEERAHFGEFEELLEAVDPYHEPMEEEGEDEVRELVGESTKKLSPSEISKIVFQAMDQFWMGVEEQLPETTTNEIPASVEKQLIKVMTSAVKEYIDYNTPG